MSEGATETWLRRELGRDATVCLALVPIALMGGLLLCGLAFLFCMTASWLGLRSASALVGLFGGTWEPGSATSWTLTSLFWVSLMVTGFRHRGDPGEPSDDEFSGDPGRWQSHLGAGVPIASPWVLLMFPEASSRAILDLLHIGPRMVRGAVCLLQEWQWLRVAPTADAARLLSILARRAGRLDWADYEEAFASVDRAALWRVLRFLPGVVALESGVTLTEELRSRLRSLQHG